MAEEVVIRRVDRLGRVVLPAKWRAKYMRDTRLVSMRIEGDRIIIEPARTASLTEFFDSVEADVPPKAFKDYNELKKALLGGGD